MFNQTKTSERLFFTVTIVTFIALYSHAQINVGVPDGTFANDLVLAASLKRYNCNLERVKVLSRHEIEVGVWVQAQCALSLCQTICTKTRSSKCYSACNAIWIHPKWNVVKIEPNRFLASEFHTYLYNFAWVLPSFHPLSQTLTLRSMKRTRLASRAAENWIDDLS